MNTYTGWFLDAYPSAHQAGITLWIYCEDGARRRFFQRFPLVFYAAGPTARLRELALYLRRHYKGQVKLWQTRRQHLLKPQPLPVLAVQTEHEPFLRLVFHRIERPFFDVKFFDVDIRLTTRYAAVYDVFPLTRVEVEVDDNNWVQSITPLDSRWDPELLTPVLRVLTIEPDRDPYHAHPVNLRIRSGGIHWQIPLAHERQLLYLVKYILQQTDPDIILSGYGDGWVLPYLINLSRRHRFPLPLNRDPDHGFTRKPGIVFHAFGRTISRGPQTLLHGRIHFDARNSMTWQDVNLEGIFETARLSGLALQTAARHSPGAAISSMLLITALRRGVLAPYQKEQSEIEKSVLELTHSDKGGLVFAPIIGIHENVIEVDFSSMFPMVARVYDISPETIDHLLMEAERDPRFDPPADQENLGLLPTALSPMLDKRLWYKKRLTELDPDDPRHTIYSGRLKAQKWIGVVAYGRTKYKEDTHARVEVHETITNYARKSLILAKIAAEEMGYRFLHGYIDALYLQKPPGAGPAEVQRLIDEIIHRTKLPIVLEGEYHWMAFLPSRRNSRIPAANKFFGLKVDGEIKIRGIEARRNDTPVVIARCQQELLDLLAEGRTVAQLRALLPQAVSLVQRQVRDIRRRSFDAADMLVKLTLSKEVDQYRANTAAVRAALQLMRAGKKVGAGDKVRFIYTLGKEGVAAWDLGGAPDPRTIDVERYIELLLRSVFTVLEPLQVSREMIQNWVMANAGYLGRPGVLAPEAERLPLLVDWEIGRLVDW